MMCSLHKQIIMFNLPSFHPFCIHWFIPSQPLTYNSLLSHISYFICAPSYIYSPILLSHFPYSLFLLLLEGGFFQFFLV
jgi:hypothetical protein